MIDETTGWALSNGKVIRTTSGCENWEDVTPADDAFHPLVNSPDGIGACFQDNNTAFLAVGTNLLDKTGVVVFHTSDGGKDWDKKVLPTTEEWEGTNYQIIRFTDPQNGWILVTATPGASQMFKSIYRTRDGGSTWVKITNSNINEKVSFYPDGMIFRTSDEGWISTSNPANAAGNDNQVYKTDDGGVNWELEDLSMPEEYKVSCYYYPYVPAFFGKDKKDGVMLLLYVNFENIEDRQSVLYNTSDGGRTWSMSKNPGNTRLSCFDFTDAMHWWTVDSGKSILYKTDNGGESWEDIAQNDIFKNVKSLDFVTSQIGWAISNTGIFKTTDSGKSWTTLNASVNPAQGSTAVSDNASVDISDSILDQTYRANLYQISFPKDWSIEKIPVSPEYLSGKKDMNTIQFKKADMVIGEMWTQNYLPGKKPIPLLCQTIPKLRKSNILTAFSRM